MFAAFWSLAGRFWSTPISEHISRLSWFEDEPHTGRAFTLEEGLVCALRFSRVRLAIKRAGAHDHPSGA
jgi:hypothetical protein